MAQLNIRERKKKNWLLLLYFWANAFSEKQLLKEVSPSATSLLLLSSLSFYSSYLLFCISIPIPNAHTVCHPPTYNQSLLLTFHTLYTQCDTFCPSSLYNIHIYIAFTIIYWHCSYKTIISCLATYSSTPNPASHHCLQPSRLWASTSRRFRLRLFVSSYLYCRNVWHQETFKRKGCVGWVGPEIWQNDQ